MSQRITVGLTDKSYALARDLVQLEELSLTELINRAVQVYDFVVREQLKGNELVIRSGEEGQVVKII